MQKEEIKMVEVPDYSLFKETDEFDLTTEYERGENMKNPTCKVHGEPMKQIGESKRGIPTYFCPKGCQIETGKGRANIERIDDGFFFIEIEGGEDVFCHVTEFNGDWPPEEGDLIRFKVGLNRVTNELQAVEVEDLNQDGKK